MRLAAALAMIVASACDAGTERPAPAITSPAGPPPRVGQPPAPVVQHPVVAAPPPAPVAQPPVAARPASALAMGPYATCAIVTGGEVACWGSQFTTPHRIAGWRDVTSLALSDRLICGVHADGVLDCAELSSLEVGDRGATLAWFHLTGLGPARAVAVWSDLVCAIERAGGAVACWQAGPSRAVHATRIRGATELAIGLLDNPEYHYLGTSFVCALAGGALTCAELRDARRVDDFNQPVGERTALHVGAPHTAKAAAGWTTLEQVGEQTLCGGRGACLDFDRNFVFTEASATSRRDPAHPQVLTNGSITCALDAAGAVTCWGRNEFGELGQPSHADIPDHVRIAL